MRIQTFFDNNSASFTYVVADEQTKKCAIIDSIQDFDLHTGATHFETADRHLSWIQENGYTLVWILETHIHADHLTAASYIKSKTNAQIGIGERITEVLDTWVPFFDTSSDTPMDGSQFDKLFKNEDTFFIGNLQASVMHTPGHTPACISYLIEDAVFVGDTIFMPYLGTSRADFPGGAAEILYDSIRKILSLPENTRIYTGHDYPAQGLAPSSQSTVKQQKLTNILINDAIPKEEFVSKRAQKDKTLPVPKLLFPSIQINLRCGALGAKNHADTQFIKIPLNAMP